MSWFAQNKFLAGFLVILVLALGGAGYYLSTSYGKYKEALNTFEQERNLLTALERKPLYPSAENVAVIEAEVKDYQQKVNALQEKLLKFQKPLDTTMSDTEFPNFLKKRIIQFQSVAESNNVQLPPDFYMGFPNYRSNFPPPQAVGLLHYEVKAIEGVLMKLVGAKVDEIVELKREALPVEATGYEAPDPAPVLEKYAIELTISGNHEPIREFFNQISNDTDYFYNIRFIRVENSAKEGPVRGSTSGISGLGPMTPSPQAAFQDLNFPTDDDPGGAGTGAAAEPSYDASIIMGQEKIQVYMVIDVVRFVEIK